MEKLTEESTVIDLNHLFPILSMPETPDTHPLKTVDMQVDRLSPEEAEQVVLAFTERMMKTFDTNQVRPLPNPDVMKA